MQSYVKTKILGDVKNVYKLRLCSEKIKLVPFIYILDIL